MAVWGVSKVLTEGDDFADTPDRRHSFARGDEVQRREERDAFLEQGLEGTHPGIAVKTARERVAMEEVGQRQETHALVMGHVGLDDHSRARLSRSGAG